MMYKAIVDVVRTRLEMHVSIIATCIPPIRPLFRIFSPPGARPKLRRVKSNYTIQEDLLPRLPKAALPRTAEADEEYGMVTFSTSVAEGDHSADGISDKSIQPLYGPLGIRKTMEIKVSRQASHDEPLAVTEESEDYLHKLGERTRTRIELPGTYVQLCPNSSRHGH